MSYLIFQCIFLLSLLRRKVLPNKSNKLYAKTRLIMQECLKGILKNKTVLLVTHQVDFLQNVDTIIVSFF
jgi:ABC-type transport system involved in cytochrome bd biosynthesis fused ATPase/permease subunit